MISSRAFPEDIDVAVVAHNGRQTLPRVFACLAATGSSADRITLYDIASTDDTAAWLAAEWPSVSHVRLDRNDGPNPARNRAIADARRPFLLLVDADGYLQPDAVDALWRELHRHPFAGAAVPIVVHEREPGRIQYASSDLHFICEAITTLADRPVAERGAETKAIGTAPGVCFLLRTDAAHQVGGFDARYFMGKEDGEFCYRLRLAGYDLIETPNAVAEHGSRPRSTWLYRYQIRNRWHFMLRNYELRTLIVIAPALVLHEPLQLLAMAAQGEIRAWWLGLRGLIAWLPQLREDRRAVARIRRVHDRHLLAAAPLVVRADVVGGGVGRLVKRLYDVWLVSYWRLVSRVLP
jgi:GT2 family glycosyltransferase